MNKFIAVCKQILYWVIQLTWGSLLTLPGLFIASFLLVFKHTKTICHKNGYSIIVEVGGNWGGLNLGAISFCGRYYNTNAMFFEHTRRHEFGHSIQNMLFGPFQMFFVSIPSCIRYWYFRLTPKKVHPPYDSIWFEGTATQWGTDWISRIEG